MVGLTAHLNQVHDVLLNHPDGCSQMTTLFEEDAHGAVVQLMRGFEAVIQDEQGVLQRTVVIDSKPLSVHKHF